MTTRGALVLFFLPFPCPEGAEAAHPKRCLPGGKSSAPSGQKERARERRFDSLCLSTGCAARGKAAAALHPWLQSAAPPGQRAPDDLASAGLRPRRDTLRFTGVASAVSALTTGRHRRCRAASGALAPRTPEDRHARAIPTTRRIDHGGRAGRLVPAHGFAGPRRRGRVADQSQPAESGGCARLLDGETGARLDR